MATLLFKLILSPLLIGAVSLAGRRWGPAVGGWLVGLPLTSGPVVLFLALDQGPAFAAAAAQAIMLGIVSPGVFCLTYSWLARRWRPLPTLLAGWLMVLVATVVLEQVSLALLPAFGLVVLILGLVLKLLPRPAGPSLGVAAPRWEIPLRMVVATGFVLVLTGLAQVLGPRLSGLLAPFPIFATILGVFTHRLQGAAMAGRLLRGVVLGSFSFAGFFLVVAILLQPVGLPLAFLCASGVALGMHGVSLWLLQRPRPDPW
ncbi:MAG TPA: hypothetical protein VKY74_10905 [Chloroflexia bacterium]|nr:hypothetical protein [Chloroflexia bacterium]